MYLHLSEMSLVHIHERSSVGIVMLCMFSIIAYYLYNYGLRLSSLPFNILVI